MAQQVILVGSVFDGFLQKGLSDCLVTITADSTTVVLGQTMTKFTKEVIENKGSSLEYVNDKLGGIFSIKLDLAKPKVSCLLTIEKSGYEPLRKTLLLEDLIKKKTLDIGNCYLFRKLKEQHLNEAVVQATKIKMFYKGDTIVYNADAFNISQLDKLKVLVNQLPNAELKDGVLRVNGRLIENITLSGKDFFNGNINAALDNLPAYIVSKVKVYEQRGEMSELTGRDMHDQRYVMDIKLKREYIGTWIAKLELDGGTQNLGGMQGMLMRMDERQMFTATLDANNMNEHREMSDMGDLSDFFKKGRRKTIYSKLNYYFEPNSTWRLRMEGEVEKTNYHTLQSSHTQTFLQPRDLNTRAMMSIHDRLLSINAFGNLRYRKKKYQHELSYNYSFKKKNILTDAMQLSWYVNDETEAWGKLPIDSLYHMEHSKSNSRLLSSLLNPTQLKNTEHLHEVSLASAFNVGRNLLKTLAKYKHSQENNTTFQNYALTYYQNMTKDWRRRFIEGKRRAQKVELQTEYEWKFAESDSENGGFRPYLGYKFEKGDMEHSLYRLEKLPNFNWEDWKLNLLGILPEGEFRSICIDFENSYHSETTRHHSTAGSLFYYKHTSKNGAIFDLTGKLEILYTKNSLYYFRNNSPYRIKKDGLLFTPQLRLKWKERKYEAQRWQSSLQLDYTGTPELPNLLNLLPIRDADDPLNVFLGNHNLKNAFRHYAEICYEVLQHKSKHSFNFRAHWQHTHNDNTVLSDFNSQTGQRKYTPQNTNRTHTFGLTTEYAFPMDAGQKTWFTTTFTTHYYQGEILSRIDNMPTSDLGLLNSLTFTPFVKVSSTFAKNFRGSISYSSDFQRVQQPKQTRNYNITRLAAELTWQLPWNGELSSNLQTIKYKGFEDASLNSPITLWNASLRKYFNLSKGTLAVGLKLYDILAQANNLHVAINSLSRTETFTNHLPRHAIVSLVYMFNWSSKKKNHDTK